jgi:hypothetical protein
MFKAKLDAGKKCIMLSTSHKAVNNIRQRMRQLYGIDAPCETFASDLPESDTYFNEDIDSQSPIIA